jgi:hypothetical protein
MKLCPFVLVLAASGPAFADEPEAPPPAPSPVPAEPTPPVPAPTDPALQKQLSELEQRLQKVEEDLSQAKDDNSYLEEKIKELLPISSKLSGYVDVGFFATTGNGAGTRSDLVGVYFPEYVGHVPSSWVFMGDPLSTAVNSRGEPADTGDSRAITFDGIHSRGNSSFLVNAVNLALFSGIGETGQINTSVDFVPRSRDISDPNGHFLGDFIDVKLAYGEWRPRIDAFSLTLQAGKFDSVIGYEYRALESPDRVGITPSLICRYTCGHPVGLKARARFFDDLLIANVAVTNGSHFSEGFPFSDEIDTNQFKTVAGRLSTLLAHKVEVGVSGAFGAQDFQPSDSIYQWHIGGDIHVEWKDLELTAELVKGRANGSTSKTAVAACDVAPCIHYVGGYVLLAYRVTNTFVPYARADYRDAVHESGASFVYIADLWRATVGLRAEIGNRVIAKVEATKNQELGRLPQFPDDVVTSSLVLKF